jgi:CHAD domain-containing protein
VIPIQTKPGQPAKKPDREIVEKLNQLRSELRCIEDAILALERLAIIRLPDRPSQLPKCKLLARAEEKSRLQASR